MKTIRDLTPEQGIEIANLCHGSKIYSAFTFVFYPHIEEYYEDAREYVSVGFRDFYVSDKETDFHIEITPELNVHRFYNPPAKDKEVQCQHILATHSQREIQLKFEDWEIYPNDKNQRYNLKTEK